MKKYIKQKDHGLGEYVQKPFRKFCERMQTNGHVESIDLESNGIGMRPTVNWFSELLKKNNHLKELNLGRNGFNTITWKILMEGLTENESIEKLDFSQNGITTKQTEIFKEYLSSTKTLRVLSLSRNYIQTKGFLIFSKYKIPTLEELYLDQNELQDDGCFHFSTLFDNLPSLKILSISGNEIADASCKYLLENFDKMKNLTHLDVSNNLIGETGIEFLKQLMKKNENLKINFENNTPDEVVSEKKRKFEEEKSEQSPKVILVKNNEPVLPKNETEKPSVSFENSKVSFMPKDPENWLIKKNEPFISSNIPQSKPIWGEMRSGKRKKIQSDSEEDEDSLFLSKPKNDGNDDFLSKGFLNLK
eukprot:gene8981-1080_t